MYFTVVSSNNGTHPPGTVCNIIENKYVSVEGGCVISLDEMYIERYTESSILAIDMISVDSRFITKQLSTISSKYWKIINVFQRADRITTAIYVANPEAFNERRTK